MEINNIVLSSLKDKHNLLVDDVKSIDSSEPSEGGVDMCFKEEI